MSFSDPPLPPFLPPPFVGCDVGVFWPEIPMNNEDLDSNSQFENAPPLKRPRNPVDNQPNSSTFPPLNRINVPNPIQLNRGTGHIFYKTRMCLKFLQSNCGNGEYCTFAHGPEELREPPPNWQEIVASREKDRGNGNWDDDQRIIHKMKICRKFYNGEECPYGDKCNFLHEDPSKFRDSFNIGTMGPMTELRSWSDQPEVVNKSVDANAVSDAYRSNNMKPAYWKTRLCIKWETTGQCLYGERCHFAHGHSELQVPGDRLDNAKAVHNTITIPTKPVCAPGDDVLLPLPCKAVISAAPATENAEGNKFFSKWKSPKKINRIYADWIDDLTPPPPSLPSEVES